MTRQVLTTFMAGVLGALAGCTSPPSSQGQMAGIPASLGNGSVSSYSDMDSAGTPRAIGVMFTASALENLPAGTDGHHCFTTNRSGKIDPEKDCVVGHERVLPLPTDLARRADMPFKWVLLNWNPVGHIPPGVYDTAHFDVHFVIDPIESLSAIHPGPCGPEHAGCAEFAIGRKPIPANYAPANYIDVGAVVPGMGNHLVNVTGPEFKGEKFKRAWIYGAYDGRVTFYEEMVTRAFMLSKASECLPIPVPDAVAVRGYYPTQSCVRFISDKDAYTVSLEGFAMREASAPAAPRKVPALPPAPSGVHSHH